MLLIFRAFWYILRLVCDYSFLVFPTFAYPSFVMTFLCRMVGWTTFGREQYNLSRSGPWIEGCAKDTKVVCWCMRRDEMGRLLLVRVGLWLGSNCREDDRWYIWTHRPLLLLYRNSLTRINQSISQLVQCKLAIRTCHPRPLAFARSVRGDQTR
jgi:hypothetical protein